VQFQKPAADKKNRRNCENSPSNFLPFQKILFIFAFQIDRNQGVSVRCPCGKARSRMAGLSGQWTKETKHKNDAQQA
jgi:hypothetical protein